MAQDRGFVLLDRSLFGTAAFHNHNWWRVYNWALAKATHAPISSPINTGRGQIVVNVGRGQFIFGRNAAASELGMKPSTVRNAMRNLAKLGFLDMQPDKHYTLVTIENYNETQSIATYMRTGIWTNKGQAKDTYKEHKEQKQRNKDKGGAFGNAPPLSFFSWRGLINKGNSNGDTSPLREDVLDAMAYYMNAFEALFGEPHPRLRVEQWNEIAETLSMVDYRIVDEMGVDGDQIIMMMDKHFDTEYADGCDYNILHFNAQGVKMNRFYEECY